jgi:hypothetical protein
MTKGTIAHIEALLEFYGQSSSGKEPGNAAANEAAWNEIQRIKQGPKVLYEAPEQITPTLLDCLTMPNGEVICLGESLGYVKDFWEMLTVKE